MNKKITLTILALLYVASATTAGFVYGYITEKYASVAVSTGAMFAFIAFALSMFIPYFIYMIYGSISEFVDAQEKKQRQQARRAAKEKC